MKHVKPGGAIAHEESPLYPPGIKGPIIYPISPLKPTQVIFGQPPHASPSRVSPPEPSQIKVLMRPKAPVVHGHGKMAAPMSEEQVKWLNQPAAVRRSTPGARPTFNAAAPQLPPVGWKAPKPAPKEAPPLAGKPIGPTVPGVIGGRASSIGEIAEHLPQHGHGKMAQAWKPGDPLPSGANSVAVVGATGEIGWS
jgi:hypothetical protein